MFVLDLIVLHRRPDGSSSNVQESRVGSVLLLTQRALCRWSSEGRGHLKHLKPVAAATSDGCSISLFSLLVSLAEVLPPQQTTEEKRAPVATDC